jgi:hypothetical protein
VEGSVVRTIAETRALAAYQPHYDAFMQAVKGIPSNHLIAAMDIATAGLRWRHCSKAHMADWYARGKCGDRVTLSFTGMDGLLHLDLESLRRTAIERQLGTDQWHKFYTPLKETT